MIKMILHPWNWFIRSPVSVELNHPTHLEETAPSYKIVLIHGANQTKTTFEYLRHALPGFQYINIEWDAYGGFYNNLEEMTGSLNDCGPVYLIGHSMGGIYAAHLAQHIDCIGGATISAPWGGSRPADWMKMVMPSYPIFAEVATKSEILEEARKFRLNGRWTNYISTRGDAPGCGGRRNDCVLTIDSMCARSDLYTKYIDATHYEIVMSTDLIHSVGKNFLRASEKYHLSLDE